MIVVQSFPRSPDVLAIVNAVAEEEGEPSVQALHAAAASSYILDHTGIAMQCYPIPANAVSN